MQKSKWNKWLYFTIGLIFTAMGIYVLTHPMEIVEIIIIFLSMAVVLSGLWNLSKYIILKKQYSAKGFLLQAVVDLLAGIVLLVNSFYAAFGVAFLIGMWLIFTSVSSIICSFEFRKIDYHNWWWTLITGALGIGMGLLTLFEPDVGAIIAVWPLGIICLLFGLLFCCKFIILLMNKE